MTGHAHRDAVEAGGGEVGDRAAGRLGQHQRQRPRPERFGELFGVGIEARQRPRRRQIGHVRDQRIERRPALGLIEPRDGPAVGGVGAEAVNRLGRKGDQPAGLEAAHRVANGGGVGLRYAGHQGAVMAVDQCLNSGSAQAQRGSRSACGYGSG